MELLTLTIFLFSFYTVCCLWGVSNVWRLVILICGFLMVVISAYITYYDTLSRPKESTFELMRKDNNVDVIAYSIDPGVALYVLLSLENIKEPRYYKYPWSEQTQKMAKALVEGEEQKEKMKIHKPFEKSLSQERKVYSDPPQVMPTKKAPTNTQILELGTEF